MTPTILISLIHLGSLSRDARIEFIESISARSMYGNELAFLLARGGEKRVPEKSLDQKALAHSRKWVNMTITPVLANEALNSPWSGHLTHFLNFDWKIFNTRFKTREGSFEWADVGDLSLLLLISRNVSLLNSPEEALIFVDGLLHQTLKIEGEYGVQQIAHVHVSRVPGKPNYFSGYLRPLGQKDEKKKLSWSDNLYFITDGVHTLVQINFYDDSEQELKPVCDPRKRFKYP